MTEAKTILVKAAQYVIGPFLLVAAVLTTCGGIIWFVQSRIDPDTSPSVEMKNYPKKVDGSPKRFVVSSRALHKGEIISADAIRLEAKNEAPADAVETSAKAIGGVTRYEIPEDEIICRHEFDKEHPWRFTAGVSLLGSCLLIAACSYIWMIASAFSESIFWAVALIVIPISASSYVFVAWQRAKKPFMTFLLAMLLGALGLGLYRPFDTNPSEPKGTAVYATADIPEGAVIKRNQLEEREIPESHIPEDLVKSADDAVGHPAKYGVSQGQMVSIHDLSPMAPIQNPLWVKSLIGRYSGVLKEGDGKKSDIGTTFTLDKHGQLVGTYTTDEGDGSYSGTLTQTEPVSDRELKFSWVDKFGTGGAHFTFAKDNQSFDGEYLSGDQVAGQWNGEKQSTHPTAPIPGGTK